MADEKKETITVVQTPGKNGAVILEIQTTTEVVQTDPAPTGMYL